LPALVGCANAEAIAIADHVLAFEPTDSYALQGKVNGYRQWEISKQLSCTLQNPVPIRNDPRFQELAAGTRSPFNQDKDRSKLEL
jgi:hypothetical protein